MINKNIYQIKQIISEQAKERSKIYSLCFELGKPFIEHFHKVCQDIINNDIDNYMHHCREMQGWWNKVKDIRYKHNKKKITDDNLIDDFFTCGAISEDFLSKNEAYIYDNLFVPILLLDREQKISNVFDKIKEDILNEH